jgi:hypothetical protein
MMDVGRPAPEVYRSSIEKLPLAVGRARRLTTLEVVVAATAVVAVVTFLAPTPQDALDRALIIAVLALLTLPYALWRAGRRVRRYWNAFELSIGADTIRVAAKGAGRVTIRHDEIVDIVEGAGGLVVLSSRADVVVHVPMSVEGYSDVRARLAGSRVIGARPEGLYWNVVLVAASVVVGTMIFFARRAPVLVSGLILCQAALAIFGVAEVHGAPRLARATKTWALVVAVASVLLPLGVAFR